MLRRTTTLYDNFNKLPLNFNALKDNFKTTTLKTLIIQESKKDPCHPNPTTAQPPKGNHTVESMKMGEKSITNPTTDK